MASGSLHDPGSPTSLRDKVLQKVRWDIVSGRAAPGIMLSVPGLADRFEVSTTPVREALLELARNGLVVAMRNRGFRVEAPSLEELNNLFAMRVLLERFAMTTIAQRRLSEVTDLRKLADDIGRAVRSKDVPGYLECDRTFHRALVARANNPLLTRMIMELRDGMRLYGIDSTAGRERQKASVKEHYLLMDMAVAGNVRAIAPLIERHIREWKPLFTAALSDRLGSYPVRRKRSLRRPGS